MSSGDHLLSIINEILEISRIESGRVELHPEPMDLHQLLNDMAGMFRPRAEEKKLSFELFYSEEMPRYILADDGKLRQILTNLLGNALKFTLKGVISLRAKQVGIDRIAIEVKDTGIGIALEEQEKLFQPFERSQRGEDVASGTGLGLAISRNYAKLMQGDITLVSGIDAGSCFCVEFHAASTAILPQAEEGNGRIVGLAPGQGDISILIVDDEKTNRELLRQLLEPIGFVVREAVNGLEAIKSLEALQSDIVIMDLVMPGMNGIEATQLIRKAYPDTPMMIIGLSASAFEDQKSDFFQADINAFLAKPFRENELFNILSRFGGIRFITDETREGSPFNREGELKPSLANMPEAWQQSFAEALSQGSITLTRRLAEEAKEHDDNLSAYILDKVSKYDLEALKQIQL